MEKSRQKNATRKFAAALADAVTEATRRTLSSDWPLEVLDGAEPPMRPGKPVQFRLAVDGGLRGECFIEMSEAQVDELAGKFINPAAAAPKPADTVANILASATAKLQASLAEEYGELSFRLDVVSGLAFGGMYVIPLAAPADPSGAPVMLYFDCQLLNGLAGARATDTVAAGAGAGVNAMNLKLVMDVELNVSLRFGQRQLPLHEVLELSSGSVIELDRMVDEPVELLLDGKVIARGEAVMVDGNYGLRVTEIPEPIASLMQ
ncbi:MAG TPA: flagellar motor switch protein FliN [Acidobacteriaceae bacterium]|nr:flagellar motor switch protein FliN [Acidobacteriaceae bacterium]